MSYTQTQWLLTFFIYCTLGWIWESLYISMKRRCWVNRGFLYGPWLPIYGCGAVLILLLTLPVDENPVLVYLLGMVGATALEYATGAAMERIFHVRYWDYSSRPLNVNGHVCLTVSLAWGCFSVLLVKVLHPPVERLVLGIPDAVADPLSLGLTILFVTDTVRSTQAALDMKALLQRLSDSNKTLRELENRLDAAMEQLSSLSETFQEKLRDLESDVVIRKNQTQQEWLEQRRTQRSHLLALLWEKTDAAMREISLRLREDEPEPEKKRWEAFGRSVSQLRHSIRKAEADLSARRERDYRKAVSILERNPGAVSGRYREALAELKSMKKRKDKKKENGQKPFSFDE